MEKRECLCLCEVKKQSWWNEDEAFGQTKPKVTSLTSFSRKSLISLDQAKLMPGRYEAPESQVKACVHTYTHGLRVPNRGFV